MGTKRHLAFCLQPMIAKIDGSVLIDIFSGVCAVGEAVAPRKQIWSNDIQLFSQLVATVKFCSTECPVTPSVALNLIDHPYQSNQKILEHIYQSELNAERKAISEKIIPFFAEIFESSIRSANTKRDGEDRADTHYSLFSSRYAGTYFGISQAIQIDSLRFAIDHVKSAGMISFEQYNYLLLALCIAASKCSNSTGHFAQAIFPKHNNIQKFIGQRRRNILQEWLNIIPEIYPTGHSEWREKNRSFGMDAIQLLQELKNDRRKKIIYADPPYTQDQYSRFYHLYETLILYDYPVCSGRGLYRPNRKSSSFSLSAQVDMAIEELISNAARLRCSLILSYPQNGLLSESSSKIPKMMVRHFRQNPVCLEVKHRHSTMGGSKGPTSHSVNEMIYQVTP